MKISSLPCNARKLGEYWNQIAKGLYDFSGAPSTGYYRRSEIVLVERFFGNLKNKKLLKLDLWNEVHNTRILFWAAEQGTRVYGLDISDYVVNKAKENFNKAGLKADFIVSDIREIKYPDNTFDFLYTMGTIEHTPDPWVAVQEICRVLKPGGKCIVGVPNKFDPFLRPVLVWFLEIFGKYAYSPEKAFSLKELKGLLEDGGLKVIGESGLLFMPSILRLADLFFYKQARPLCLLTCLLLWPFEFVERRSEFFRKNGYLIACIAEKPKNS